MKELFEKKFYKLQSEDTYIKTLQSGQDIFRSSVTDETTKQSSRLKTEIYLNPTYLKNEYPLIPNFFGPKHTALIYGFANDSKLYSYTLKRDLKLIAIDTLFLDMLWERTRLNLEDKEIVLRFFTILGYVPSTLKGEKRKEFSNTIKRNIKELTKENTSIVINDNSMNLNRFTYRSNTNLNTSMNNILETESLTSSANIDSTFRRISSTTTDKELLQKIFNHTFENEELNNLLKSVEGFYFPPMNSGFVNLNNFLTLLGVFHEEIYLRDELFIKIEDGEKKYIDRETFTISYIELETYYQLEKNYLGAFQNGVFKGSLYDKGVLERLYAYIYLLGKAFSNVFIDINDLASDLKEMYSKSTNSDEQKAIEDISNLLTKSTPIFQDYIFNILKKSFLFDRRYFKYLSEEDPFKLDNKKNEELFFYTALSEVLSSIIFNYENLLAKLELQFIPVITGGALFKYYSHGKFRRYTKDIDIKIKNLNPEILDTSSFESPTNITNYTRLMLITYIWENLCVKLLNVIAKPRIEYYITVLNNYKKYYSIQDYMNANFSFHISVNNNKIKFKEILANELHNKYNKDKDRVINEFNIFLKEKYKKDVFQNITEKGKLFKQKRELKERYLIELKRNEQDKIITNKLNEDYKRSINEINRYIKDIDDRFDDYLLSKYQAEGKKFVDSVNYIYNIDNKRSSIGKNDYKIGYISTINININRKSYGLMDFTFDTPYSLFGTFQTPSEIDLKGIVRSDTLLIASYLDFIRETVKLKNICDSSYIFDDSLIEYNPFNKCSPNKARRLIKKEKYEERYMKVYTLLNEDVIKRIHLPNEDSLEKLLINIEQYLQNNSITDKEFTIDIINYNSKKQNKEMIIGGNRQTKKISKKRYTRRKLLNS